MSQAEFARRIGKTTDSFNKVVNGDLNLKTEDFLLAKDLLKNIENYGEHHPNSMGEKIISTPGKPQATILPKDVCVLGVACCALAADQSEMFGFTTSDEPVDFTDRFPPLLHSKKVYALRVSNDSMAPMYPHGTMLWIDPGRPPKLGDIVIITQKINGEEPVNYVKELVKIGEKMVEAKQLNPAITHEILRSTITHIHKVLSRDELLGI